MNETVELFAQVRAVLGAYAPYVMLVAGILLLMVPRWLRVCIAVALIAFGLVGIWPELLGESVIVQPQ